MEDHTKSRYAEGQLVNESMQSTPVGSREEHGEEFAAELAAAPPVLNRTRELHNPEEDRPYERSAARVEEEAPSRSLGWVALVSAIISLFVLPVFLGITAIALGVIAYMRGTRGLGAWSVVIGGISVLAYVVLIPTYYS